MMLMNHLFIEDFCHLDPGEEGRPAMTSVYLGPIDPGGGDERDDECELMKLKTEMAPLLRS